MADARYYISLALLTTLPGAFVYWFSLHGFIQFWRRLGLRLTATVHVTVIVLLGLAIFHWRGALLSVQFGTNRFLIAAGVLLVVLSIAMRVQVSKELSTRTLIGLPEIAPGTFQSRLLTDGIYSRMRHPRYTEIFMALNGWALIANYLAIYALVLLTAAALLGVVLLEEKELRERFGTEYEAYARRVPRFVPARTRKR